MFVRTTVWGGAVVPTDCVPKVIVLEEKLATAALPTPVPVRVMICGLPLALSLIVRVAERLPAEAGVKVTEIVQFVPAATDAPHVLLVAKSPGLAPFKEIPMMFRGALPVLFSVTDWGALVTPRF